MVRSPETRLRLYAYSDEAGHPVRWKAATLSERSDEQGSWLIDVAALAAVCHAFSSPLPWGGDLVAAAVRSCGNPCGWVVGGQGFPTGVGRSGEAGGWWPGAFHTRAASTAGVGGLEGGWGARRRRRAATGELPHDELPAGATSAFFLRIDSPLSFS
jgi:hypothetical protein